MGFLGLDATNRRLFSLIIGLNRVFYGRDCLSAEPKDQPPRNISGKRTVKTKTLESERCSTEGLRSQVPKTDG